jgi:hypothetical protein
MSRYERNIPHDIEPQPRRRSVGKSIRLRGDSSVDLGEFRACFVLYVPSAT